MIQSAVIHMDLEEKRNDPKVCYAMFMYYFLRAKLCLLHSDTIDCIKMASHCFMASTWLKQYVTLSADNESECVEIKRFFCTLQFYALLSEGFVPTHKATGSNYLLTFRLRAQRLVQKCLDVNLTSYANFIDIWISLQREFLTKILKQHQHARTSPRSSSPSSICKKSAELSTRLGVMLARQNAEKSFYILKGVLMYETVTNGFAEKASVYASKILKHIVDIEG